MSIPYAIEQALALQRKPRWNRLLIPIAALAATALAINVLWWCGWRVNWTESEPLGLYRLLPVTADSRIIRSERAEFCPPPTITPQAFPFYMKGDCPGGGMPMFKQIVGLPGDRITVTPQAVTVNGKALAHSGQLPGSPSFPRVHLPYQHGTFTLGPDQFWVYGSGARPALAAQSFDSRYWGPITRNDIRRITR
ncbi:Peptidase S26, conserved region [Thiomonas sp. X19]|uniref:S26 family signal peptidase n=1 Tax=Thiomonas sp. X19 TaxID=1050370 RepID=UPI000B731F48|nr:S26 family signal peptidase [Thiomonas sp. X19]SCC91918.1 Peptidase S26, conserved region [Thiomonas sp. X19]